MSDLALAVRQIGYKNKSFWRNPASAFFTFAFPLMFLVIFNLLFGSQTIHIGNQTVKQSTFYVPAIATFSVITACFTNIAISITFTRDGGILKRIRGTPLPPWAYLFAQVAHATLMALLLVAIVTAAGALFYDVSLPTTTMGAFVVAVAVGAASFCAMGLALTAAIPNADASPAIVNAAILPLLFISGIFIPLNNAPDWLITVAKLFPVYHLAQAMEAAFDPTTTGSGFHWGDLGIVALWGVAGLILAARFFDWEPRQ
jgi:ABC-2 type transport system permease protein